VIFSSSKAYGSSKPFITDKSGLHNKPAGCGAAEVYASGPGSEEEEDDQTPFGQPVRCLTEYMMCPLTIKTMFFYG
jgi:hypothetical protein